MKALGRKCRLIRILPRTPEDIPSSTDICINCSERRRYQTKLPIRLPVKPNQAHTSGSVLCLHWQVRGRAYRCSARWTFSKGVELNYSEIPVFIEGDCTPLLNHCQLWRIVFLTPCRGIADSSQRKRLHLASSTFCMQLFQQVVE